MCRHKDDDSWPDFSGFMFSERRHAETAEMIAKSLAFDFPAGARVLDQGCGPAGRAVPPAHHGRPAAGIGFSPVMPALARTARTPAAPPA